MTMTITRTTADPSPLESNNVFGDLAKETENIAGAIAVADDAKFSDTPPICYSEEELEAIRQVRNNLIQERNIDPSRIGLKTLALTTIVSKLRVEEASKKYATYLKAVDACGVPNLRDDEVLTMNHEELEKRLKSYASCGRDEEGRSIMWIKGQKEAYPEEDEPEVVKAAIMYHTAIHADALSLHKGITFIIDTSNKPAKKAKNDQRLQKTWQAMPMRPQAILIAGASLPLRVIINVLIGVASLFTKQKILDRIKFVKISDAFDSVPKESAPEYLGGGGGNIKDIVKWTKDRINGFPAPSL